MNSVFIGTFVGRVFSLNPIVVIAMCSIGAVYAFKHLSLASEQEKKKIARNAKLTFGAIIIILIIAMLLIITR
ncbi:MAG: hypothetical protein P4L81_02615 [Candidatus Pacebacteria bacterium]|nr:hypothetical protein [Candidatus Paceibacterota bacterium]